MLGVVARVPIGPVAKIEIDVGVNIQPRSMCPFEFDTCWTEMCCCSGWG